MAKAKGMERARVTWPGDPEGTIETRVEKEKKENEAALKKRAEQDAVKDKE